MYNRVVIILIAIALYSLSCVTPTSQRNSTATLSPSETTASEAASAQSCGIPSEVAEGNKVSDQIYAKHVKTKNVENPCTKKPADYVLPESYGAVGTGSKPDTDALKTALKVGKRVWLGHNKIYRITSGLILETGMEIISDGTATILMAKGKDGFNNTNPDRSEKGIYSEKGAGLLLKGEGIVLNNFFLVKEYEDVSEHGEHRYVIGLALINAHGACLNRLRIRGFSLAPGIIAISSSNNVVISNSLIHASCIRPKSMGSNKGSFQISGIIVDDFTVGGSSKSLNISNNVITDLVMDIELLKEQDPSIEEQTDGITIASTGEGNTITGNFINDVDEAIDTFAHKLAIKDNILGGRGLAIKLIWGARCTVIEGNEIVGRMRYAGIGLFQRPTDQEKDQVKNITIRNNMIDMRSADGTFPEKDNPGDCNSLLKFVPGICVENKKTYPPIGIHIEGNRILVKHCKAHKAIICDKDVEKQCIESNNPKFKENVFHCLE